MNLNTKIRISILLCLTLLFYSFQPVRSVGAASIGEPVPTDVSYWGFDENTTSSILNQGYNNILCLWDFENHEYLLVKCPDHMYYVPGGIICIDGDYTGLFDKLDYQNYIRDQIVYSWGREKGYFNLSASQYFTVYRVSSDGSVSSSEVPEFNGVVNGTAWNSSKTKYNALRWLYENDLTVYNSCNYALCWATDSIDYAYSGSGNVSVDLYHWASGVLLPQSNHTEMSFTGGSTLNAAASDIPVYTFYPGGFHFTSPVVTTPTPTPTISPIQPWSSYPDLPANFSSQTLAILKYHSSNINDGQLIGIASSYIGGSASYSYPTFYKDRKPYNYNSQAFCNNAITFNTWSNSYLFSVFTVNYDESNDIYSVGSNLYSSSSSAPSGWYLNTSYWWRGETLACWSVVPNNQLSIYNIDAATFEFDDSYFEILFTNKNYIPGSSENPYVSVTPTPTSSPTPTPYTPVYISPTPSPVPSPGVTITPTQGPTETSVKELRGWKGALQRILQTVFVGNTEAIEGYFKDAVGGYQIVQNPFKQIVDSIYVEGSDQENFNPFENQQVDFIFDVHDQNGNVVGGEHTTNWRLTILPKTFWEWLKSYSNYFEIVFYMVDASFLGATMKRWLTKQNDEGSETKEGGGG